MTLVDIGIAIACVGMGLCALPSILSAQKPHRGTCIIAIVCLLIFTACYAHLLFWWSVAGEILCLFLWSILLLQKRVK